LAILNEMASQQSAQAGRPIRMNDLPFSTGLMLMTAFAASIGGYATPVGTPPNLIGIGMISKTLHVQITFFQWMAFCVPLTVVLLAFLVWRLNRTCGRAGTVVPDMEGWLSAEKRKLGQMTRGQINVLTAFGLTVALWIIPGAVGVIAGTESVAFRWLNSHLSESVVSLFGALMLFVLPINFREHRFTLTWKEAMQIDWGTILLFGGGLALGELMFSTGLASWLGEGLAGALHVKSNLGVIALFTFVAIIISEATSNTASATMVVPGGDRGGAGRGLLTRWPSGVGCNGLGFIDGIYASCVHAAERRSSTGIGLCAVAEDGSVTACLLDASRLYRHCGGGCSGWFHFVSG